MKDYIKLKGITKSNQEVFEPFKKLPKHERTVYKYINLCNNLYKKYAVKEDWVKLFEWTYYSAKLCEELLNFDTPQEAYKSFKKLKHILKYHDLLIRRHYIYKMEGIFFEIELEEKFPHWKKTDYYLDRTYQIDFLDYEKKLLLQGKYSGELAMKEYVFNAMNKFKNDYPDYKNWDVAFVWKSKITGEIKFYNRNREEFDYGKFFKTESK